MALVLLAPGHEGGERLTSDAGLLPIGAIMTGHVDHIDLAIDIPLLADMRRSSPWVPVVVIRGEHPPPPPV